MEKVKETPLLLSTKTWVELGHESNLLIIILEIHSLTNAKPEVLLLFSCCASCKPFLGCRSSCAMLLCAGVHSCVCSSWTSSEPEQPPDQLPIKASACLNFAKCLGPFSESLHTAHVVFQEIRRVSWGLISNLFEVKTLKTLGGRGGEKKRYMY